MQIRRLVPLLEEGAAAQASKRASLTRLYRVFRVTRAHRPRTNEIFSSSGQADRPIRKAFQLVGPFARSRSRNNFHSRIALSTSLSFRSTRPESSGHRPRFIVDTVVFHFLGPLYFFVHEKLSPRCWKDMLKRERYFRNLDVVDWYWKYCRIFVRRNVFCR